MHIQSLKLFNLEQTLGRSFTALENATNIGKFSDFGAKLKSDIMLLNACGYRAANAELAALISTLSNFEELKAKSNPDKFFQGDIATCAGLANTH